MERGGDSTKTTKEEILIKALALFAERGYDAVSTGMLAGELGITKGALYRHFESKQAIYDAIFAKMIELDAKQAEDNGVPGEAYEQDTSHYGTTSLRDLCGFVNAQFVFWTENEFARLFRRLITIEQFKSPELMKRYQDVIAAGPVAYTEDIFREMLQNGALNEAAKKLGSGALALELFAPLQLSIQLSDGGEDRETVKENLRRVTAAFEKRYEKQEETV